MELKKDRERNRNRKRKRKRKALKVSSNRGKVNILKGEIRFNFKNPFQCGPIFSPSITPFKKPIPKSLRKFS
jgi:hypothetical protein